MRSTRGQAGFGLLEALVSILLTSMVILGLAGSLLAAIKSSAIAERVQRADSALGSFTESLKTMGYPEPPNSGGGACPELADFDEQWDAFGDRWQPPSGDISVAITAVEHWQPDSGSYASTCPSGGDPYTHLLTVEVSIEGKERSAQVVVADR
ncbi:MAG: type II secretion system GspH family protein [Microthrixaceae bacterium]|nr:type II secretion system GspH family protein [Microthrixaceae bacterium]